jgi:tetratricopeptide (TPR) repeat protein
MSDDDDRAEEPDLVGTLLDRGWELLRKNDLDGARKAAEEARQLDPRSGEPVTLLGAITAASGDVDGALELYRRAVQIDPEFVAPLIYAAEIQAFEREEYEEALRLVGRALDSAEEEEDFVDALLLKAEICLAQGDAEAAAQALDELPPTQLPDATLEARAGRAYLDLGELEAAEDHFQQAIVLDPKNADAYHGLGMVYEEQDDTRAMVKAWLRVRELDLEDVGVPWTMTQDEFEGIGERALEELPERIAKLLENVPIVAADYPSIEIVAEGNDPRMLGFFSGVPYPEKSHLGGAPHLDCVFLYKLNIERMAKDREEATKEVRITLLHETGHFFGLSEEELEEMGLG